MIKLTFTTEYADVFIGALTQVVGQREKRICRVALSKSVRFTYRGAPERFAGEFKLKYRYEGARYMFVPLWHRRPLPVTVKEDEEPITYRRPCLYCLSRRTREDWNNVCRSLDGNREYVLQVGWDVREIHGEPLFAAAEDDEEWEEEG